MAVCPIFNNSERQLLAGAATNALHLSTGRYETVGIARCVVNRGSAVIAVQCHETSAFVRGTCWVGHTASRSQ
ncbi:hypothetical protein AMP1_2 [Burkholderia phage AMP1]|uniref:Uncharacterized protein n=1 Tax=Burkholderia phage AMP1 TaxID=2601683 RepID=A0A5C2IBF7_9CAUD|nr:hypothetical protein AMP1_2 [Burkholderia phage AMP1]